MKTKLKIGMLAIALLTSIVLTSCTIENEGPIGPAGKDGWSDIKVITFTINYDAWRRDDSEINYWFYSYNSSLIDYYVIDNGALLFYYGFYDNSGYVNTWYSIPFTNIYYDKIDGRYYEKIYDAIYQPGSLEISIKDKNPYRFQYPEEKDMKIKVIILEGTKFNALKNDNVDLKNYSEVSKALNLEKVDNTK